MRPPLLVCLLLACLLILPCFAQPSPAPAPAVQPPKPPPPPPPVIQATVNGSPISEAHVDQAIANHWATPLLRSIIEDRLVRQEARRQGLKISVDQVQAIFEAERKQFPSQAAFERHLHAQGYNSQGYIEKLTTDSLLQQLIARATAVSDEEIKNYYLDHQADFARPAQMHVFLIVTDTIEEAYLVRERLLAGDKFDAVARELSQHPSKEKGGDLGWVMASDLPDKALADAIMTMEPGVVSSPLPSGGKYYVALVKERRPEQVSTLDEARAQIAAKLQEGKAISREDYVNMLARKGDIQVNWAPAQYLAQEYRRLNVIAVVVNGKPVELAQAPVKLPDGTIIVPAKPVLEAIGAVVAWQAKDQSLYATTATGRVKLTVGSSQAIVEAGKPEQRDMKHAPEIRGDTLFIAPRAPLEALGATVEWDGLRNRIAVTTVEESMPSPTAPKTPSGLERQ